MRNEGTARTRANRSEPTVNLNTREVFLGIFIPALALMTYIFICEVGPCL